MANTTRGKIEIDGVFAEVDEDRCSGCRVCNELCPYSAIEFNSQARRSRVIPAACKACGSETDRKALSSLRNWTLLRFSSTSMKL